MPPVKFRLARVGLQADEARDALDFRLHQRMGLDRVGIVRWNFCDFFCFRHQMIRDVEPESHPIRLPVVSDAAVHDPHCLRLHSSTRDPAAYLAARDVIELTAMLTAPVVAFDRAMLEVPLKDVPLCVDPSRSPAPCYARLRPSALNAGKLQ
jgi:hypothetical protein